jgi:hypothetical protein
MGAKVRNLNTKKSPELIFRAFFEEYFSISA